MLHGHGTCRGKKWVDSQKLVIYRSELSFAVPFLQSEYKYKSFIYFTNKSITVVNHKYKDKLKEINLNRFF